ncbi:MAG: hypothetical protein B7Y42_08570 [Polaromonas sp. 28-63-22]|nr:MAG: hypothetical protein B7Y42_08570 [Polaromonas sp. 28-63-22]
MPRSGARLHSEVRPFALVNCADMVQEVVHLLEAALRQISAQVTMDVLPEVMGIAPKWCSFFSIW